MTIPQQVSAQSGQTYELIRVYKNSETSSDGSSSSANGRTAITETVVGDRPDGRELLYDLPSDASADQRAREWMLPARVLRGSDGKLVLLNAQQLIARRDNWMSKAKLPKAACGKWYFTWNAFKIECEPMSVLETISGYAFPHRAAVGESYTDRDALAAGILKPDSSIPNRMTVDLILDAERIRKAKVDSDLVVAEISGDKLSRSEAEKRRAAEVIKGTRVLTLDVIGGEVVRTTEVTRIETIEASGTTKSSVATVTLTRQPAARAPALPNTI